MQKSPTQPIAEISVNDAASLLGCTPAHVRCLLRTGQLTGRKFTSTSWAVSVDSLDVFAKRPKTVGRPRVNRPGPAR